MARLASLVVNIGADTRGLKKGLDTGKKSLIGFQKSAISLRGTMVALAGAAGLALVAKRVFDLGSAVEETASKFNTVFGPAADSVQEFIDDFGTMAGLSNLAAQEVLATTGAIVQGMGFAQAASAAFAQEVVVLAGDLSSFNNIPIAETSLAIQSALTGERESLKRLGVVILETDVQKRALADTGKEAASALTQEEKAAATLALITERAGVAMGDLVRTQDSAANVARKLGARWENLKEIAATSLLPIFADLLSAIDSQTESMGGLNERILTVSTNLREMIFRVEQGVIAFQVIDAKLNLFFAKANAFQRMKDFFNKDLPGSVRVAELALNNLVFRAGERTDELDEKIKNLRKDIDDLGPSANEAAAAARAMAIAQAFAADTTRTMQLALVPAAAGMSELEIKTRQAVSALRSYNEEASTASKVSGILGTALGAAGLFGGLGPLSGIIGKAATAFGLLPQTTKVGKKAAGGPVSGGGTFLVGERGPELFTPKSSGNITPNHALGGGDMTFNFVFEQGGIEVGRITKKQRRDENLGRSIRLALPAPAVG